MLGIDFLSLIALFTFIAKDLAMLLLILLTTNPICSWSHGLNNNLSLGEVKNTKFHPLQFRHLNSSIKNFYSVVQTSQISYGLKNNILSLSHTKNNVPCYIRQLLIQKFPMIRNYAIKYPITFRPQAYQAIEVSLGQLSILCKQAFGASSREKEISR